MSSTTTSASAQCANPDTTCPEEPEGNSSPTPGLCKLCSNHYLLTRRHRDQQLIDLIPIFDNQTTCFWCHSALATHPVPGTKGRFCSRCHGERRNRGVCIPRIGLHFPADHSFTCEGVDCQKQDKSMSQEWHCVEGQGGALLCLDCWWPTTSMAEHRAGLHDQGLSKRKAKAKAEHKFGNDDFGGRGGNNGVHGFLLYCNRFGYAKDDQMPGGKGAADDQRLLWLAWLRDVWAAYSWSSDKTAATFATFTNRVLEIVEANGVDILPSKRLPGHGLRDRRADNDRAARALAAPPPPPRAPTPDLEALLSRAQVFPSVSRPGGALRTHSLIHALPPASVIGVSRPVDTIDTSPARPALVKKLRKGSAARMATALPAAMANPSPVPAAAAPAHAPAPAPASASASASAPVSGSASTPPASEDAPRRSRRAGAQETTRRMTKMWEDTASWK